MRISDSRPAPADHYARAAQNWRRSHKVGKLLHSKGRKVREIEAK